MKKILLFVALFSWLSVNMIWCQTTMTLVTFDGEESDIELSTNSRITFEADSIVILFCAGADTAFLLPLDDVRKLFFSENTITKVDVVEACNPLIYPNPMRDNFMIKGIDGECPLAIYSMNGMEVLSMQYKSGDCVDVSMLASGAYIIRVGNYTGKFIKR